MERLRVTCKTLFVECCFGGVLIDYIKLVKLIGLILGVWCLNRIIMWGLLLCLGGVIS